MTADPLEEDNLALDARYKDLIEEYDALLRKEINYPSVSMEVAKYNQDMAKWWTQNEPNWKGILGGTVNSTKYKPPKQYLNYDWGELWKLGPAGYWKAWDQWLNGPVEITKCSSNLTYNWPPQ